MFSQQDYQHLLNHCQQQSDSKIYSIVQKHGYLQPPPKRGLFSLLVGAIIGQKIRFAKARTIRGKVYTILGADDFTPEALLANLNQTKLIEMGLEPIRAKLIIKISEDIRDKNQQLETVDDVKSLTKYSGIGPWTINNILLMYSLNDTNQTGFFDYLLDEDLIIRRGLQKLYNCQSKEDREKVTKNWAPYRGILTWYLWKEFS